MANEDQPKMDLAWHATAAVATLASGLVAEKVVAFGWKALTGHEAPRDEEKLLDYQLLEVVAFAVISGATITLMRQLTLRQAAKWYGGRRIDPTKGQKLIKA